VLEAIDCLLDFHGIPKEDIAKHKEAKLLQYGSYTDHRLVDYVEYPVGSEDEKHCLANPDRYPELCDDEEVGDINNCCK